MALTLRLGEHKAVPQQLTVSATSSKDIPVVMGIVVATAIIVVIVNLLIDLAQAALNPKVRLS